MGGNLALVNMAQASSYLEFAKWLIKRSGADVV